MYNVDIFKIIDWFIPPRKRYMWLRVWLRALNAPIAYMQGQLTSEANTESFDNARAAATYKLKHNSQVVYLQKMLNDNFDVDERRITIENAVRTEPLVIYRRAEWDAIGDDEKVYLYRRAEGEETTIYRRIEGSSAGGFIVNVPFALSNAEYYKMRSLLNYYKLASKIYTISLSGLIYSNPVTGSLM